MDMDEFRDWLAGEYTPESHVTVQEVLDALGEPDYQFDTYEQPKAVSNE